MMLNGTLGALVAITAASSVPAPWRLRGAAGCAHDRSRRPPRGGAADPGAAQAHDHLRRAARDPADGRQGLLLRDRAAVGHRPGHGLRAHGRPPDGRDRLGQPARERRRADRRRLRQAPPPPRPVRPLPPADPQPGRQPGLRRRASSTRSPAPSARAANGWWPSPRFRVPIFTVLMRRSFGVAGNNYATPRSAASVRVAWPASDVGGIPPEGGIEAAYKRQLAEAGRSRRAPRRDQRPHRERARPDRPAQPLPDRGDDRSARHPPAGLRVGGRRLPDRGPARRGWCRGALQFRP